jgi:anaphase-promoting complex subunit 6
MCYLRGLCYAKQNAFDRARDCYKDAVRIDIQCFEAFDQLMKNSLMSPAEELEFLESLDFDSVTVPSDPSRSQEAAHFVKMLYTTRLSKYTSPATLSDATETLSTHYNLSNNPDILLSRAEALYTQCRFLEALELTSSILTSHETGGAMAESSAVPGQNLGHSPAVYPLHLACLYETGAVNALFLLSHTLADNAPEEPYTYLAIGVYYLSVAKIAEARRFFSKASLLDPHSAPAWIGFAHTFAAEGEHDQAIAAYSTAARLFQGSHLPQLFLGMQHLALNNMSLAHEYLCAAYAMSSGSPSGSLSTIPNGPSSGLPALGGDPLVLNELGVVLFHQSNMAPAADLFRQALNLANSLQCDPGAWVATRANLGHALRRMGRLDDALAQYDECIRVGAGGGATGYSAAIGGVAATSAGVAGYEDRGLTGSLHTSRGLVYLQQGRTLDAVTVLHEAVRVLGVSGGDAAGGAGIAGTILARALELWSVENRIKAVRTANSGRQKRDTASRSRDDAYGSNLTEEIVHGGHVNEDEIEMELDEHAEGLLSTALNKVRPRRAGKRPQRPGMTTASIDPPEEMDVEEPIGRSRRGGEAQLTSRRSPTRRVQPRHPEGS